ncbi:MAG: hypothetical protein MOIL_00814 [Candidatus Methanolliviera sp. GoM_oil]|nr:MAG: hypothetical protein MOIL_00814 [Candidatus Methanolliviera sp. GoM_oil]
MNVRRSTLDLDIHQVNEEIERVNLPEDVE